jgi:hypothetical protein
LSLKIGDPEQEKSLNPGVRGGIGRQREKNPKNKLNMEDYRGSKVWPLKRGSEKNQNTLFTNVSSHKEK